MGWFRVLIETWWWVLLGALVGGIVGYLLGRALRPRDVTEHPHFVALRSEFDDRRAALLAANERADAATKDLASLRARNVDLDARAGALDADVAYLKEGRVLLEKQVADRDRRIAQLERDLAACTAAEAAARAGLASGSGALDPNSSTATASATAPAPTLVVDGPGEARGFASAAPLAGAAAPDATEARAPFDAEAASTAFGAKVVLDDLKIVEGIGPKIEELLHGGGIRTWRALADAPIDRLREVLKDGGDRFRMHDPATWPEQAALADEGRFADLQALQARLDAGRG